MAISALQLLKRILRGCVGGSKSPSLALSIGESTAQALVANVGIG
jgi:hypothetical protein|tara:strand:- start:2703 stop:2837 length:135 start_codon:yes stop_codon:yes gene_type:complete